MHNMNRIAAAILLAFGVAGATATNAATAATAATASAPPVAAGGRRGQRI